MTADRRPTEPLKLYDFALSGHCHRVRLMLSLLDLPHGEQKRAPFLALRLEGEEGHGHGHLSEG